MGGSGVVAMVMGDEWLRWVMTKHGSRVVCDWERMWCVEGCCVMDEARERSAWSVDPDAMCLECLIS